jgi:hypothetical protein
MQATLELFGEPTKGDLKEINKWGCETCQVRHTFVEFQGRQMVRCGMRGARQVETYCKCWLGKDPLEGWPPLPDNYVLPKEFRK